MPEDAEFIRMRAHRLNQTPFSRNHMHCPLAWHSSTASAIVRRAIRRSDRHRGWLRSNFVARERQEAEHLRNVSLEIGLSIYGAMSMPWSKPIREY
jgi:hypothetical protein